MNFNISLVLCVVLAGANLILNRPFLEASEKQNHKKALWFKLSASLCFLLIGVIPIITKGIGFSTTWCIIAAGLFFGVAGDVILSFRHVFPRFYNIFFVIGAATFSFEHYLFIGYFTYSNSNIVPVAALCFVIGFAAVSFVFAKLKVDGGKLKFGIYAYIAVVVAMFSTATATAILEKSISSLMFSIGSLCFAASDTTICVYNFSPKKDFKQMILLHYLYSPAQILIALSLLFVNV